MLKDVRDALGLSGWGFFYRAVKLLEAEGLVQTKRVGKARVVYAAGTAVPRRPEVELMTQARRRVATLIVRRPGMDMKGVIDASGLSLRMAYHHVKALVDEGFVSCQAPGDYRELRPTGKLFRFLGIDI